MPPVIAVVGCLDTKGEELAFIKERIESQGCGVRVLDTGVVGDPGFAADISRESVAEAGGASFAELRDRGDRGYAVTVMSAGAAKLVRELFDGGEVDGIIAAGGSANTTIGATAMQTLPVGVPKMLVSTLASGDVSTYVDTKDVTMMYSVVDVAGINRISARILANAASAVCAMARSAASTDDSKTDEGRPIVAATMFGVTTPCVTEARRILEEAGYEVLVFHATGTGGRAMEGLIEDGYIAGVLDITTTELADEHVGGILSAGPRRLTVAGAAGIPQVVSVGAVDMVNFGPIDTVPPLFRGRLLYQHNENVTLMRTTPAEHVAIGRIIAERLATAGGPVKVLLPLGGVSLIDTAGQPFHDPDADARLFDAIRAGAGAAFEVESLPADINDPAFARASAEALIALLSHTNDN